MRKRIARKNLQSKYKITDEEISEVYKLANGHKVVWWSLNFHTLTAETIVNGINFLLYTNAGTKFKKPGLGTLV